MKRFLLLSALVAIGTSASAQADVVGSGGDGIGSGGTVSYTVGQVFYQENNFNTGIESQGVQQPYEVSVVTDARQNTLEDVELQVFPNPTAEHITILATGKLDEELTVQLFDALGRELTSSGLESTGTEIPMQTLASATYFLVVRNKNSEQKTYQIIKR